MAPSYISSASQAGTSITVAPSHIAGDFLVRFDYRDGSATAPTLATGWTNWPTTPTGSGNTQSARLSYKIAASSSETVGAAASATGVVCHVYRGAAGPGSVAWGTGASATITYPALTRSITDGTSWGVRFGGQRNATNLTTNSPSTVPNTARTGVAAEAAGWDSNGVLGSNPTSGTQSTNGSTGWEAVTAEILAPRPAISTISDDFNTGSVPDAAKWATQATVALNSGDLVVTFASFSASCKSVNTYNLTADSMLCQARAVVTDTVFAVEHPAASALYGWIFNSSSVAQPYHADVQVGTTRTHTSGNWYRVRESGGTIFYDYSTNGTSWTNHFSAASPGVTAVRPSFWSLTSGAGRFDNFNVPPASTSTGAFFAMF